MVRIVGVQPLNDFVLALTFSDGSTREVDVDRFLHGPVFDPLRADPRLFRTVRVDAALGTIVWPTGADLCPDVLLGVARTQSRR
jgi:anaerobic glycerol-3-phosphate dehydrogenase